jgi:hypothetical protein
VWRCGGATAYAFSNAMTGPPGPLNAPNMLDDVQHWRWRAKEARKIAALMNDPVSRGRMLRIAQDYEQIALHAQWRSEKHPPSN